MASLWNELNSHFNAKKTFLHLQEMTVWPHKCKQKEGGGVIIILPQLARTAVTLERR